MSDLATTLARISTDPALREEYPGDRQALKDAARILRTLTTEWGVKALFDEGVLPKSEDVARAAASGYPKSWALVSRQVAATEWEETP